VADPSFDRNWRQGMGDAAVLANVGVIWTATGPTFAAPGNQVFALQGGKWINTATGKEASAEIAAMANQALAVNNRARALAQHVGTRFGSEAQTIQLAERVMTQGICQECKSGAILYHHNGYTIIWRPHLNEGTMVVDPKARSYQTWLAKEGVK
jgi:hypothetical protein